MPILQNTNIKPWVSDCPVQDELYGDTQFFSNEHFSCRYIISSKLFIKSLYIPYGPKLKDVNSVGYFLDWINSFRFTKVKIDLYRIVDKDVSGKIIKKLELNGFKKTSYIQDSLTSIIDKDDYKVRSKERSYIKKALNTHDFKTYLSSNIKQDAINECYSVYEESCISKGYKTIRSLEYFNQISKGAILSVALNKQNGKIDSFLISNIRKEMRGNSISRINFMIFMAMTDEGRMKHLSYGTVTNQFDYVFSNNLADEVDFIGASVNSKDHNSFKTKFGSHLVELPGSYERFKLL